MPVLILIVCLCGARILICCGVSCNNGVPALPGCMLQDSVDLCPGRAKLPDTPGAENQLTHTGQDDRFPQCFILLCRALLQ